MLGKGSLHRHAGPHAVVSIVELLPTGLALLGPIDEKFVSVSDVFEPLESGQRDKSFISKGQVPCDPSWPSPARAHACTVHMLSSPLAWSCINAAGHTRACMSSKP